MFICCFECVTSIQPAKTYFSADFDKLLALIAISSPTPRYFYPFLRTI